MPSVLRDQGWDLVEVLDRLQANGVNALHLSTHAYGHGEAFIRHDPARFAACGLGHHRHPEDAGRDRFGEMLTAAKARGMRVYARYLDGWNADRLRGPGWDRHGRCEHADGSLSIVPCFAQERVREWSRLTLEDVAGYPVDGLLYGIERGSPLSDLLSWGQPPRCFCAACRAELRAAGIDPERVRAGMLELSSIVAGAAARRLGAPLSDHHAGHAVRLFRTLSAYPELLHADRLQAEQLHAVEVEAVQAFARRRPEAETAVIAHLETDLFKAVHGDWAQHGAGHAQAVMLRLYTDILGPRMVLDASCRTFASSPLGAMSVESRLDWLWQIAGFSGRPPAPAELLRDGLDPAIGLDALRRCRQACAPQVRLQVGIGVDISHPLPERRLTPVATIQQLVAGARAAGVDTIVLCREYPEIRRSSMRAAAAALGLRVAAGTAMT